MCIGLKAPSKVGSILTRFLYILLEWTNLELGYKHEFNHDAPCDTRIYLGMNDLPQCAWFLKKKLSQTDKIFPDKFQVLRNANAKECFLPSLKVQGFKNCAVITRLVQDFKIDGALSAYHDLGATQLKSELWGCENMKKKWKLREVIEMMSHLKKK